MSEEQAIAPYGMPSALQGYEPPQTALNVITIPDAEMDIIRRDFTPQGKDKLTDEEFEMFITTCRRSGLHPALRQIHCAKFNGRMTIMMGIDGYRMIAERQRGYGGRESITWYDEDGKPFEFWSKKKGNPAGCKVVVIKLIQGQIIRTEGKANWDEFNKAASNQPNNKWKEMPAHMLAIRAESHALRAAFPNELRGVELSDGEDYSQPQGAQSYGQQRATMRIEPQQALHEPQSSEEPRVGATLKPLSAQARFRLLWREQNLAAGKDEVAYVTTVIGGPIPAEIYSEARAAAFQKALEDLEGRAAFREAAENMYRELGRPETRFWADVNIALGIQDARNRVLTGEQWAQVHQWASDQRNEQRGGGDLEMSPPETPDPFRTE